VGHIGILGLEKAGEEFYQITLGGDATETAALGERAGPGFASGEVADAIGRVVDHYLEIRDDGESFLQTCRRVGPQAFKDALYATH
ncbi:MAG: nitrite/sulfite reductase, partial [Rhodobiaceae bacterium]|nr:nitrite/sulfite reductase [Rhodobiaceae bacterium]